MHSVSRWKLACLYAVSDGVPTRSLCVGLIVGTILNLINQGDAIFAPGSINWFKVLLTYLFLMWSARTELFPRS